MESEGGADYEAKLATSQFLQLSATDHVPLDELKMSFDAHCRQLNHANSQELTREFLAKYNMTLMPYKGAQIVTGLKQIKVVG